MIYNIRTQFPNIKWNFNTYNDIYTGCRNLTFQNESLFETNSNNYFFKCNNKIDINIAPNVCVSSKYRQKRFYAQIKMFLYEIIILILWNLYNTFSVRIIYKYYPNLKNDKPFYEENENYSKKNIYNKNQNRIVTFKDINDKELNNNENNEEEEEEEEYEEEEEEEKEKNNIKEVGFEKVFKMRKISKKRMKTYKKKKKKKYKEDIFKNKNIYFDDEILNLEYYEGKIDFQDDPLINKEEEKDEKYISYNIKYENNKNSDEINSPNNYDNNVINNFEENENEDLDNKMKENNQSKEQLSLIEQLDIVNTIKNNIFIRVEQFQWWRRLWKFLFEKYILNLKYKTRQIFIKIDKNIKKNKN